MRKVAGQVFVFLADCLGIDRDKRLAAGKRLHRRTQAFQNLHHDIAAYGGMLVHADSEALQSFSTEEFRIALAIIFFGFLFHCRERGSRFQHASRVKNAFVKIHRLRDDSLFILLGNFTLRVVELDAVAVGRDMATRHHDGRERLVDAVQRNRRARDAATVHDLPCAVLARLHERLQNTFGTRAQVARNRNRVFALVAGFAVLDKATRIYVANAVRHRRHQAASTARSKSHAGLFHHFLHRNTHIKPLVYSCTVFFMQRTYAPVYLWALSVATERFFRLAQSHAYS